MRRAEESREGRGVAWRGVWKDKATVVIAVVVVVVVSITVCVSNDGRERRAATVL
jgi:hypothetical protein